MNKALQKLFDISRKPARRIIGLMSGTSLDGLDVVLCEIANCGMATHIDTLHFETIPYTPDVKQEIRKVFAKEKIEFKQLCLLNPWLGNLHADLVLQCLHKWNIKPAEVDLIASHGQTVYHCPKILHGQQKFPNATLQIADGDHIAVRTGIITISDFRQKHLAAGGEGAPLALYGDYIIFSKEGENRIMLNMGGIANFTFLPGSLDPKEVFVTDTGPGNTLLDAFSQHYFHADYDRNAIFAKQGTVNTALLQALLSDDFFSKAFPRTTGPELFNIEYVRRAQSVSNTHSITSYDMMATLTRFSAESIAGAIQNVLEKNTEYKIYMSGGGAHNPLLTGWIQEKLAGIPMRFTDELGISADSKEAVLFAVLANETVCGGLVYFGKAGMPAVSMGKISLPLF